MAAPVDDATITLRAASYSIVTLANAPDVAAVTSQEFFCRSAPVGSADSPEAMSSVRSNYLCDLYNIGVRRLLSRPALSPRSAPRAPRRCRPARRCAATAHRNRRSSSSSPSPSGDFASRKQGGRAGAGSAFARPGEGRRRRGETTARRAARHRRRASIERYRAAGSCGLKRENAGARSERNRCARSEFSIFATGFFPSIKRAGLASFGQIRAK